MHSAKKSLLFAINLDDIFKFRFKFARSTQCFCMSFMVDHVCIKIEAYIHKIPSFLNLVDNAQSKIRLTGFQIRFLIFKQPFLKVICIAIIFLPVIFYLFFLYDLYRHYNFDRFCHRATNQTFFQERTKANKLSLRIFSS